MPEGVSDRRREPIAAALLFLATAAFTLWQNTRVAAFWDLSYLLDSSWRIALGQLPYKDFPFVHPPLEYLLHAAIIRIFGRVYYPHILCAALEAGLATLLTWRILLRIFRCSSSPSAISQQPLAIKGKSPSASWVPHIARCGFTPNSALLLATLLAAPLTVLGIYAIYPQPVYDSDCILAVLFAIYLLQRPTAGVLGNLLAGAACALPIFIKQNIGLPFLAVILFTVAAIAALRRRQRATITPQLWIISGALATLAAALLTIQITVGLRNYLHWTITFAAQRRMPGFSVMLGAFHQTSLLWTIPSALVAIALLRTSPNTCHPERTLSLPKGESKDLRSPTENCHPERSVAESKDLRSGGTHTLATLLLAAPFLWTVAALALTTDSDDRADQLLSLWPHLLILSMLLALWNLRPTHLKANPTILPFLPTILLAVIYGALLSQQLWGSTYALWPLLMLLIASLLTQIPTIARPLAVIIAATFLICGGLYALSHERLSYVHLEADSAGPIPRATLPSLRGLATPGPWLPTFEELVRVTNADIPTSDAILLLPGEDPFYFASGRTPQFPVLLFDPATDPYTPQQTLDLARARNVRWLIVSRDTQLAATALPELPEVLRLLLQDFVPYRTLTGYTIYRRK